VDNQLKHRLTGATILVLLIVLLVPEMLSGPQPAASPVVLPADAQGDDVPMRSFDINVSEPEAAPAPDASASDRPSPGTDPAANPAPSPVPAPIQSAPMPRAIATPAAASGTYFVQLGSFSARDSATNLAAQLKSRGFAAAVTPVTAGGRTLHRVRVGPVANRAAGDALASRLRAAGHAGSVVSGP
jgi:cell division septation protein DedD